MGVSVYRVELKLWVCRVVCCCFCGFIQGVAYVAFFDVQVQKYKATLQ